MNIYHCSLFFRTILHNLKEIIKTQSQYTIKMIAIYYTDIKLSLNGCRTK